MEDGNLEDNSKLLVALRLIRLDFAVEKAWSVVDDIGSRTQDPDFLAGCVMALTGIGPKVATQTIQRIVDLGQQLDSANHDGLSYIVKIFGDIESEYAPVDSFLLKQLESEQPELLYAAATALTNRKSILSSVAEKAVLPLLGATQVRIREVGALCLLRCFKDFADETIQTVTARLRVERDIEVLEMLMRICQRVGVKAFPFLFEDWKSPTNLRGWVQTMTLSWLGEESYAELFKAITEAPGEDTSRFLALMIMGVKVSDRNVASDLSSHLRNANENELTTLLIALQNSDSNAAFLVPDLVSLVLNEWETEVSELATKVIQSIGVSALSYFPETDREELQLLRQMVESGDSVSEAHVIVKAKDVDLKRFAAAARLMVDEECKSLKQAGKLLAARYPNEKGWSENSLKRSFNSLESFLSKEWNRIVSLIEKKPGERSTSPSLLSDEGKRILTVVERHMERSIGKS